MQNRTPCLVSPSAMLAVKPLNFILNLILKLCLMLIMGQAIGSDAQTVPAIVKKLAFEYLKKSAEQQKV